MVTAEYIRVETFTYMGEQKDNEVSKMLSKQLNLELTSYYNYLKLESICMRSDKCFCGLAEYFRIQKDEELAHARGIQELLIRQNMKISWEPLTSSFEDSNAETPADMIKLAYENEKRENENIHATYKKACEEGESSVCNFLQAYIDEQVTSMNEIERLMMKVSKIKDETGMMIFDMMLKCCCEKKKCCEGKKKKK